MQHWLGTWTDFINYILMDKYNFKITKIVNSPQPSYIMFNRGAIVLKVNSNSKTSRFLSKEHSLNSIKNVNSLKILFLSLFKN